MTLALQPHEITELSFPEYAQVCNPSEPRETGAKATCPPLAARHLPVSSRTLPGVLVSAHLTPSGARRLPEMHVPNSLCLHKAPLNHIVLGPRTVASCVPSPAFGSDLRTVTLPPEWVKEDSRCT